MWFALKARNQRPALAPGIQTTGTYVEELIGPDTINTVPPATLDAFRDHGQIRPSLVEDLDSAEATMKTLASVGVSIDEVTSKLTDDGVGLFVEAFAKLLEAVEEHYVPRELAKLTERSSARYTRPRDRRAAERNRFR